MAKREDNIPDMARYPDNNTPLSLFAPGQGSCSVCLPGDVWFPYHGGMLYPRPPGNGSWLSAGSSVRWHAPPHRARQRTP